MQPKFLILPALSLCSIFAYAQQLSIDSLKTELAKAKEDTNKVILYRMLTGTLRHSNTSEAIEYGKQGVALGKKLNFDKGVAGCYLNISACYSTALRFDSSLLYIDTAIVWSHRAGDPNRLALAYLNRADLHMQTRNLKKSLLDCDTALSFAEKADNNDRRARVLQTIGSVYYIQEQYPQSREYYDRAYQLYQKINNKQMSAIVLNNIGNIYKRTGQPQQAIDQFLRAIQLGDSVRDINNLTMYYGNLSDAYLESGQYELAEQAAAESLKRAGLQKNIMQTGIAYNHLSQVYLKQKKYGEAITAATKALDIAKEQEDLEWQQTASGVLAEAYSLNGNHQQAYRFLEMNRKLSDSLARKKYDEDIAALQTTFRLNEKNNEILLLNKNNEVQQQQLSNQRVLIIGSIIMALLALGGIALLVSRYRLRQRMKELQIRNQIAADLHDEVGSSLSSIHMLSQMVGPAQATGASQAILEKVSNYTRETMDKMGDIVWMIKPQENDSQGLKERMQRFLYEMCNSKNITGSMEMENFPIVRLSMQQRKAIYLVFKEAVNNAVKYSGASSVLVSLSESGNKVRMTVRDNGNGFNPEATHAGNGLDNMRNRARELGGEVRIDSVKGEGTTVSLTLPLK